MRGIRPSALACALLFAQGVVQAQPKDQWPSTPMSFEKVASGATPLQGPAGEKVLATADAYKAFIGMNAPPSVRFGPDKGDDVVLAIRRSGWTAGSSIEITRVLLGLEGGASISVEYVEHGGPPSGPGITDMAPSTFVAVKVQRPSNGFEWFTFNKATPAGGFTKLVFKATSGPAGTPQTTKTITIDAQGAVTCDGTARPALGADQLRELKDDFAESQFDTLPLSVSANIIHIMAPSETFTLSADLDSGKTKQIAGEQTVSEERAKALIAFLYKLRDQLAAAPGMPSTPSEVAIQGWVKVEKDAKGDPTVSIRSASTGPVVAVPGMRTTWPVPNEPFRSILAQRDGKFVHARATSAGQILSIDGGNLTGKPISVRDANGQTLGTVNPGQRIAITGERGLNYQVTLDGKTGFVTKTQLRIGADAIPLGVVENAPGPPSKTLGAAEKLSQD